jgi:hypothetical protein
MTFPPAGLSDLVSLLAKEWVTATWRACATRIDTSMQSRRLVGTHMQGVWHREVERLRSLEVDL